MLQKIIILLALAIGLAASQFPEFSQQYLQRLVGQYDALAQLARDFDTSAARAGLTRAQALADLTGSTFREAHRADMQVAFARLERIGADLMLLRAATPLERMALPHRFRDGVTLAATWADFRPALPLGLGGVYAAGLGFLAGLIGLHSLIAALAWPFRKAAGAAKRA